MAGTPHVSGTVVNAADLNDRVKIYDRSTSQVDVTATVTETTIYTKSISAGHMSTDRALYLQIIGDYLRNAAVSTTYRIKFGGTTIAGNIFNTGVTGAVRSDWALWLMLGNRGAANVNFMVGGLELSPQTAGSIAGIAGSTVITDRFGTAGDIAIDTASAQTLAVTLENSTNSASMSMRKNYAQLWLL